MEENKEILENEQETRVDDQPKENTKEGKKSKKLKPKEEIIELKQTIAEMNDKFLRINAEFDNYRKRTLKEKMELTKSAGEKILINILPVLDNLERAEQSVERATDLDAVKEGIALISQNFRDFLKQQGVVEIEVIDKPFDTELSEAITKIPAPKEEQKGMVVDCTEKGYLLNDKVIRYAKVVVGE